MSGLLEDNALCARVEAMLGARPVGWRAAQGGYTEALRGQVTLASGATAFVKVGVSAQTAGWLRAEARVYSAARGDFISALRGWDDDGDRPILALEDLSEAFWPPPWTSARVDAVLEAIGSVAAASVGGLELPPLEASREAMSGWQRIAADPAPFLGLGVATQVWLDHALDALVAAERAVCLEGDALLHMDLRSDNMCLVQDRAVFVDWNWACRGSRVFDVAAWLPSLHSEGGPAPESILPDAAEEAAALSGYFASKAGLPPCTPSGRVRVVQRTQLSAALPWAVRALGLPALDGPAAL